MSSTKEEEEETELWNCNADVLNNQDNEEYVEGTLQFFVFFQQISAYVKWTPGYFNVCYVLL